MKSGKGDRYEVTRLEEIEPVTCPCGSTRRAFVNDPARIASMHLVTTSDSKLHYHKQMTELYYFLEGEGHMELDGERYEVGPGSAILIKPGCRHRAVGSFKIINVPVPAFDPEDEWFD